jgi:membrane protein
VVRERGRFTITLARRAVAEFRADGCGPLAAAISYHALFSLFPLAIVLAGVFGLVVRLTGARADVIDTIVRQVPLSPAGDGELRRLLEGATGDLSTLGLLGLLGVLYGASGMMAALRSALARAWDVAQPRPFLRGKLVDVGLVGVVAVIALLSLALSVAARFLDSWLRSAGLHTVGGWAAWLVGVVLPLALAFAGTSFVYVVVPPRSVPFRHTWPIAALVAVVLLAAQTLFAFYVRHFADYNAVYGSLGAVIAFMVFVQISSTVFLLGAEAISEWPRALELAERPGAGPGPPLRRRLALLARSTWTREESGRPGTDGR